MMNIRYGKTIIPTHNITGMGLVHIITVIIMRLTSTLMVVSVRFIKELNPNEEVSIRMIAPHYPT